LQDAGVEIDPFGDLNTESERKLGQLVSEKYFVYSFIYLFFITTLYVIHFFVMSYYFGLLSKLFLIIGTALISTFFTVTR